MGVVSKSTTYPAKITQGVEERFTEARSLWIQLYCKITNVRGQMISKEVVATLMNLLSTNLSQVNTFHHLTCSLPAVQLCSVDITVKCTGPDLIEYHGLSAAGVGI
jgi:hypothetical protein